MKMFRWIWEFIKEYSTYNYHAGKRGGIKNENIRVIFKKF